MLASAVLAATLTILPGPGVDRAWVEKATDMWSSCPITITVTVEVRDQEAIGSPRACAHRDGSHIVLYRYYRDGSRRRKCPAPGQSLAHEIGHAVGLPHGSDGVMSMIERLPFGRVKERRVTPEECDVATAHY